MTSKPAPGSCLNCGAELRGAFCSACGQRAIAPYPTVRELVGDAWQELSGYDGRFARTLRVLLGRPGALTADTLEGRRARYVSPVRFYLLASVVYFVCAASVPNVRVQEPVLMPGSGAPIRVSPGVAQTSAEERAQQLKDLERAPWWAQAIIRPVLTDPEHLRNSFIVIFPRVLFALVPVFAAIVALFYRRRRFTQHLVFAIHLHTVVFLALTIRELSQLGRSLILLQVLDIVSALVIAGWSLAAFQRVYRERWPRVMLKGLGIAMLYWIAGMAALIIAFVWAGLRG